MLGLALTALLLAGDPSEAPPEDPAEPPPSAPAAPSAAAAPAASTAANDGPQPPERERGYQTPPFLPRYMAVETFINQTVVVPALRLAWEVDLIAQPRNVLAFVAELGLGYAVAAPQNIGFFWEHVAMGGLGYRMQRDNGLHWGLTLGIGAVLYGNRGPGNNEQKVNAYVEGKLHIGLKLKSVTLSLCGGWAQPTTYDIFSVSQSYVGGPFIGILFGWK